MATKKKAVAPTTLTFIVAPDLPPSELSNLESHWAEALRDPSYTIVTNYELRVDEISISPNDRLFVLAPDIPPKDLAKLNKTIADMRRGKKPPYKALNYNITAFTVPR